ncbi:MAG: HYR domain-containing protein [Thermoplasmatota archaeon]
MQRKFSGRFALYATFTILALTPIGGAAPPGSPPVDAIACSAVRCTDWVNQLSNPYVLNPQQPLAGAPTDVMTRGTGGGPLYVASGWPGVGGFTLRSIDPANGVTLGLANVSGTPLRMVPGPHASALVVVRAPDRVSGLSMDFLVRIQADASSKWSYALGQAPAVIDIALAGDTIGVLSAPPAGGDRLVALSWESGTKIWDSPIALYPEKLAGGAGTFWVGGENYPGPTAANATLEVQSWDAKTGQRLWKSDFKSSAPNPFSFQEGFEGLAASPDGEHVVSAGTFGHFAEDWFAVSLSSNGTQEWHVMKDWHRGTDLVAGLAVDDQNAYVVGSEEENANAAVGSSLVHQGQFGAATAFNVTTGNEVWTATQGRPLGSATFGAPEVSGDGLYVSVEYLSTTPGDQSILNLRASDGSTLSQLRTGDPTTNSHMDGIAGSPDGGCVFAVMDGRTVPNSLMSPPSGQGFVQTLGFHTVATLGGGSTACRSHVPPVLHLPPGLAAEATGPAGATVTFAATATDARGGALAVKCSPSSGSVFAIATTRVDCAATDGSGNSATDSFTVNVHDTTPPTLVLPTHVTQEARAHGDAVVTFDAAASDLVDGAVAVSCAPASGSTFALGDTLVGCGATDAHGNSASGNFTVTVARGS